MSKVLESNEYDKLTSLVYFGVKDTTGTATAASGGYKKRKTFN